MIYNKYLQHTILEEGEGALIFATPKGLAKANSPDIKVSMTDATFKCCPKKECTGIYQMLIFHIIIHVVPTGCDFHYNQAILRKIGKKGLKKTMSKNAEFKAWVHQVMSLNHLPSDKIEQTFRELCLIRIPFLSASAKKEKESFQRYWERFWLGTIGVDRMTVYNAPLWTNNHCESYHAKLPSQIGVRKYLFSA